MRLFVNWTICRQPCNTPKQPFDCCINNSTTHTHLHSLTGLRAHRSPRLASPDLCMGNAAARERDEMRFRLLFIHTCIRQPRTFASYRELLSGMRSHKQHFARLTTILCISRCRSHRQTHARTSRFARVPRGSCA